MIQPWLFVWYQGFSGTKAQGNGVCWWLSHTSCQDFRWCSGISQVVVLFMWKELLMTKNGAVSTEGITQPQSSPGKLDYFPWIRFHRTPQTGLLIIWPKRTLWIPLFEKWEMKWSKCSSEPQHRTELTHIPKCDDRVDEKA